MNNFTVGLPDLDHIDVGPNLIHQPSKATGHGRDLLEALRNLGKNEKFRKWVEKRVKDEMLGRKAEVYAHVNPHTMEIEIGW